MTFEVGQEVYTEDGRAAAGDFAEYRGGATRRATDGAVDQKSRSSCPRSTGGQAMKPNYFRLRIGGLPVLFGINLAQWLTITEPLFWATLIAYVVLQHLRDDAIKQRASATKTERKSSHVN